MAHMHTKRLDTETTTQAPGINESPHTLNDDFLFKIASQVKQKWEELLRNGLIHSNSNVVNVGGAACLPSDEIRYCRELAPKDPVLQAYHALARWRWFCRHTGCSDKQAFEALLNASRSCQIHLDGNMEQVIRTSTSLEFV
ncbi:hypothetical protein EG68_04650 [Paragonimus skrjabini miyazakii]|uniref:Uncharacterized protein n=1 Tax=Paragonimus skrjabini miyazakii TaxID=59628 RepID=A0A8S9YGC1_9TREM|nr:hypothetical protein EG68_04650 [Paragonimus skrjabini miyazakii]